MIKLVLEQARALLDKIDIYEINIQALAAQHKLLDAIAATLPALELLGINLPAKPTPEHIGQGMARIQEALAATPIETLPDLPEITDPQLLATMRLLASLFSVAYIAAPALMPLVVFEQVAFSIKHGNAAPAPFAYANYGLLLAGVFGDIPTGARFGEVALRLLERLDARKFQAKTLVTTNFFITHWTQHARVTIPSLLEGYRRGVENGDFEYAGYALFMSACHAYLCGDELARLAREFAANSATLAQLKQERTRQMSELYRQVVANLREPTPQPWRIQGDFFDEDQALAQLQAANDRPFLVNIAFNKLLLAYLFEQHELAAEYATLMAQYLEGATGSLLMPLFHFYNSLTILALAEPKTEPALTAAEGSAAGSRLSVSLDKVASNQQKLVAWSTHAPMNHHHRWQLVEAERARVSGEYGAAREPYDQAIALAQTHGYLHEEALACELAGRFYLARGQREIAHVYLRKAHYAYQRWGAEVRARQLETRHPQLAQPSSPAPALISVTRTTQNITQTSQSIAATLDLASVLKASQAISSEIVLENLLTRLMQVVIENAGAERGALLLERDGQWLVEAQGGADDIRALQSIPLAQAAVPAGVVNYVARTLQDVVLSDAVLASDFAEDSYIAAHRPRSLLCAPLLRQGRLVGMLYLENNLAADAFTPDRLAILHMLSSQVAISIENAQFYAHLEELVTARTTELRRAYETVKTLNERLQGELSLARYIQQNLLPHPTPAWEGLDVACYTAPAWEVGGDLYAYHAFGTQGRYALAVGDVSGKGMPAALLMAVSVASFHSLVTQGLEPGAFLTAMDRALADYTRTTRQNCALACLELRREAGTTTLLAANAGSVTPLLKWPEGAVEWIEVGGFPLGAYSGRLWDSYATLTIELPLGAMIVLTSDGVVEAMNGAGELFGFERLEQAVASGPQTSAAALLGHVRVAVKTFVGATEPHDDVTIVVARV